MKTASLPNLNRETTSYPQFISLPQDVDHSMDMTLNGRPNIDHGDDTEASETSPFNDILSLSLSLSPLVPSNEIGFLAAPRSVRMFRCESEHTTSSVGSNQISCDSGGARSEGTNPTQMDYYQQPQMSDSQIQLQILQLQRQQAALQALLDQQRLFLDPSQSFPRSVAPSQTLDMPQAISTSLPQAHLNLIPQQILGAPQNRDPDRSVSTSSSSSSSEMHVESPSPSVSDGVAAQLGNEAETPPLDGSFLDLFSTMGSAENAGPGSFDIYPDFNFNDFSNEFFVSPPMPSNQVDYGEENCDGNFSQDSSFLWNF